jgi:hypothetical protein
LTQTTVFMFLSGVLKRWRGKVRFAGAFNLPAALYGRRAPAFGAYGRTCG